MEIHILIFTAGSQGDIQPYVALGVGPPPLLQKQLTVDNLSQAIQRAVTDRAMGERARALGTKIRAEDGIAGAIQVIQKRLQVRE